MVGREERRGWAGRVYGVGREEGNGVGREERRGWTVRGEWVGREGRREWAAREGFAIRQMLN